MYAMMFNWIGYLETGTCIVGLKQSYFHFKLSNAVVFTDKIYQ